MREEEDKYSNSSLSEEKKREMAAKLLYLMETKKYFMQSNFNVDKLSQLLHSNKRYIYQLINEKFDKNFNDFVNEYRVREARKMLRNRDYFSYSIEGIGYSVGFRSRSTFHCAFKKFTGLTPASYQKTAGAA